MIEMKQEITFRWATLFFENYKLCKMHWIDSRKTLQWKGNFLFELKEDLLPKPCQLNLAGTPTRVGTLEVGGTEKTSFSIFFSSNFYFLFLSANCNQECIKACPAISNFKLWIGQIMNASLVFVKIWDNKLQAG